MNAAQMERTRGVGRDTCAEAGKLEKPEKGRFIRIALREKVAKQDRRSTEKELY